MSSTRTMGIAVTDVSTTQQLPLGFEYHEPASGDDQGEKVWVYVQMTGSAAAQGDILMRVNGSATYTGILSTTALHSRLRILGVAQHAIAENSYGFILRRGIGSIRAGDGAALTINTAFTTNGGTTAGRALDFADGAEESVIGFCIVGTSATAATANNAYINCGG